MDTEQLNKYKERLETWNSTDKYLNELKFLGCLIDPRRGQRILDYGCGIGTAINSLSKKYDAFFQGYDKFEYWNAKSKPDWFISEIEEHKYDKIFFMHSLAHIPEVQNIIRKLLLRNLSKQGEIIVITPNKEFNDYFKEKIKDSNYKKDETVIEHFSYESLSKLFTDLNFEIVFAGRFGKMVKNIFERLFLKAVIRS